MIKFYFFGLLTILLLFSCAKPELNADGDREFPLQLSFKKVANGIEVSWDEVKINNFQTYVLTRQSDSLFFNTSTDTTWTIDDYATTKILDKTTIISPKLFYKITAKSLTRTLTSKQTAYERSDLLLFENITFNQILANAALGLIYIYERFPSTTIRVIDINKRTITPPISLGITLSSSTSRLVLNSESPNHLFLLDNNGFYDFDAKTLELKSSLTPTNSSIGTINSIATANDYIYTIQNNSTISPDVFSIKTGNIISPGTTQNLLVANLKTLRYLPNPNKLLMLDNSSSAKSVVTYTINIDGTIKDPKLITTSSNGYLTGNNFAMAGDGSTFVSTTLGELYNANVQLMFQFPSNSSISGYTYSPDSKYIAYRTSNNLLKVIDLGTFKEVVSAKITTSGTSNTFRFLSFYLTNDNLEIISTRLNPFTFNGSDFLISKTKYR
jgi:hypothetical protein